MPPNGGNPHPLPHVHGGFWHDEVLGNIPMDQVVINPHNQNLGAPYEDVHAPDAAQHVNLNAAVADMNANDAPANHAAVGNVAMDIDAAMDDVVAGNSVATDVSGNPVTADAEDYIPLPEISSQFETNIVPSPQFIPCNTNMEYNVNQTASNTQSVHTDSI